MNRCRALIGGKWDEISVSATSPLNNTSRGEVIGDVPLWVFPLTLVCGNTSVLKPGEKLPQSAILHVELLEKAGRSNGVSNLVRGGRECVEKVTSLKS